MRRLKKIGKGILIGVLAIIFLVFVSAGVYMQHPKFGKAPSGKRLERIRKSPHYKDGRFQNASETPTIAEGYTFWRELRKSLFNTYPHLRPNGIIPSVKTDLHHLPIDSAVLVWFGHSSCFIQAGGKRILIDPVFNTNASPVPGSITAFEGTTSYTVADLPDLDCVLISHDHYDHLDYETVLALKNKTKKVICGLGVGAHFEYWGYPIEKIIECDWHEKVELDDSVAIYTLPTRHKSGRGLKQDNTLWLSFLLQTPETKIYISGDGGYDKHFKAIGDQFGPIDLAIMEDGQYDSAWHYVHLLPEEGLKAAQDLKAKRVLPVHHSKFVLARHAWNEPLNRLSTLATAHQVPLVTPRMGEIVSLSDTSKTFDRWWKAVQ
ncbi:MBL fold metallo-hydrolase [Chryseolinea soli]|uniref:MBL fold metallo-hydrolase n=1 Tax=Chryseolinea soli TaxID=2321403 RepID=A0A385SVT9_9BACT|nr:MBL fold metallo-hydrolase [Chryseolinea soli]AYB35074.1 MBL fold metallo-hydrolase [Chryseolinea soli]